MRRGPSIGAASVTSGEFRKGGTPLFYCTNVLNPTNRHQNRDAVLAHVKIHYQDASYPKSNSGNSSTSPLQVSVGGSPQFYMNKVFAAMCLSQTQSQSSPNSGSAGTSPAISAGLLQRAIQEAQHSPTPNASALSGLALALAGGKPQANTTKASAASILEHGEQKASQNEASADSLTSPNTTTTNSTTSRTTKDTTARSLQDLLTSPRSARNGNHPSNANSNSVVGNGLRLDAVYVASSTNNTTTPPPPPTNSVSKPNASPLPVTTTPTPISTATPLAHPLGAGNHRSSSSHHNDQNHAPPSHMAGDGCHLASGLTHAHIINTNTKANPSSNSFPSSSSSSSSSSMASTSSAAGSASASASSTTSSPPPPAASSSASAYMAAKAPQKHVPTVAQMSHPQTRFHSHSPGSPSLLTMADGDRREPSPYRCGHCHQVSNWKHVIQVWPSAL